ncbi:MAG: DNA mismatch repair protein MutS [Candidatus Cloacimonetes bacterium]|nr:DNA mismatch repair protein MutS [Candidatus Cloacimonadota bacterium]
MNGNKITPFVKQFMDVKKKHPDKLILFRMGDFFETFFDDAKIAARILGITLTARNKSQADAPAMAGFPYHALDSYLDKLVKAGQKVVIVEQIEDPKLAKGIVKRDIVEIITPGAILDEKLLAGNSNNFLASVFIDSKDKKQENTEVVLNSNENNFQKSAINQQFTAGLALLDLSTGDFLFTELPVLNLKDELLRQKPKEIIVECENTLEKIKNLDLDYNCTFSIHNSWFYDFEEANSVLKRHFQIQTIESIGGRNKKHALIAAAAALTYIKNLRKEELNHITSIRYYSLDSFMVIDETTRRNLELFQSMRYGGRQGSLIDVLDQTKTPMGSRLLYQWMSYPLINIMDIYSRQDAVEDFKDKIAWTKDLRDLFNEIGDLSRIISKLATLRVNPRDLLTLVSFLESSPAIIQVLSEYKSSMIAELKGKIGNFIDIINLIKNTILPNPVHTITEGNIIKEGVHTELDELRQISKDGKSWIAKLEESEKRNTGIPSLKVGFNKVFGYYIEITNTHKNKVPNHYICKQTLVNCERYISPQLKEHESRVLGAEERIKSIEYEIFSELRKKLSLKIDILLQYVEIIAQLDVLANFGFVSWQNRYEKPVYNNEGILKMSACRHPVIEKILTEEQFIPNDVYLNNKDYKIALLTGPNMAGKSTYLRQIGLCILMAQIGCFIPCEDANIPVFDRIFTRVGASDNLAMGQSTFLVEMIETANILHSATTDSLILLDEIGRGTSTFDGLSLAWSIVEFIHNTPQISAKTLFATHYHELTELEHILEGVKNFNISVKEWNEKIVFIRKIERGGADQSYGIQVARLAGVPQKVIIRAKEILKNLEAIEISPQGLTAKIKKQLHNNAQVNLFDILVEDTYQKEQKISSLKDMIIDLDLNNLTPLQAYQKLEELKKFILN